MKQSKSGGFHKLLEQNNAKATCLFETGRGG